MYYTIKQFAKMFHTTEHTIRYYTDINLLPCQRDGGNRRIFDEESINWMQGITCLKGCGASIEDIKEYCNLCRLPEEKENLIARYQIILRSRKQAYKRVEEARKTAKYMDEKVKHYEDILAGAAPDDTNPRSWTAENRPQHH
ncbi:HTH-type transcriptional regulator AdhR [uncultured Roseburia sp.]|uniref:MerR family transcriptional regulator n=1 Tax=Brotonthovivens ammoniilytica TaxID=2981725 RepID=A0ABT2TJ55_9FIRM|nr:MerR family transcriptional regulator [Brotonthovivens ammoniilytica]MCU6761549.1 MerR family transcriptional regulator [Brotonthovivens ammoniilytica]SCI31591.1 HTH-type transcriptional regulator AdhR [uncultured Roseburia sp.]